MHVVRCVRCGAAIAFAASMTLLGPCPACADELAPAGAAESAPSSTEPADDHARHITDEVLSFGVDEVVVSASPIGRTAADIAQGVSVLDGTELLLKQQPTMRAGRRVRGIGGEARLCSARGASSIYRIKGILKLASKGRRTVFRASIRS